MIARRLRSRRNGRSRLSDPAASPFRAKLDPHEKRALLSLRWIFNGLRRAPRTLARMLEVVQSGVISPQRISLHPSVPEADTAAPLDEAAAELAGFVSAWMCDPREITTVDIACLKISCS